MFAPVVDGCYVFFAVFFGGGGGDFDDYSRLNIPAKKMAVA